MSFNPAECIDEWLLNYPSGQGTYYANVMASGFVAVIPYQPLVIKTPVSEVLGGGGIGASGELMFFYDSLQGYLGLNKAILSYPVCSGVNITWNVSDGVDYVTTVVVTNPNVAFLRFQMPRAYAAHTTEDFERITSQIRVTGNDPASSLAYDKLNGKLVLHDHTPALDQRYGKKPASTKGKIHAYDPVKAIEYDTGVDLTEIFSGRINFFNADECADKKLLGYDTGNPVTYDNGMISGFIPVTPGRTYAISTPSAEIGGGQPGAVVYFYDTNKSYLGISTTIGSYPIAPGQTVTTNLTGGGRGYSRLALSQGTPIRYIRFHLTSAYTTHTTEDFDRIRNGIQVEANADFTQFVTPEQFSNPKLLPKSLPQLYRNKTKMIKSGSDLYIRTPWSTTHDFVQRLDLGLNGASYENNPFRFTSAGLILKSTLDNNVPGGTYETQYMSMTDDICPANFNGTYIGANHGAATLVVLTVSSHDKTVEDVGSEWTDGLSRKWYLLRVVNNTTLWVMSEDTSATDVWSFYTSANGTTLSHSANATHQSDIVFSSQSVTQLWPAIKNQSKQILEDGHSPVTEDGVYLCDFIDIKHTYDISHVPSILDYVISQVGGSSQPAFDHESIDNCARFSITYRFHQNGSVTIYHNFKALKQIQIGYIGFIQCAPLLYPGGTLHEYIPKIGTITVGGNAYDFKNIEDISSIADSVDLAKADWDDAANPPERFVQFAKDSGAQKTYGICIGYNQDVGIGQPSIRASNSGSAAFIYTSKKQYPRGVSSGSTTWPSNLIPAGTVLDMVAFRAPINYTLNESPTNASWYFVGDDCYLMVDFHETFDGWLNLPDYLIGMKIAVVESDGITINSGFVSPDGIALSVPGTYGTLVARLYK